MKVVITGGSGFIGRALAKSLIADGHEVVVLTRDPRAKGHAADGARPVAWDGRQVGDWQTEIEGAKAVVNLAGASLAGGPWTEARKRLIRSSRVNAGQALVKAIEAASARPDVLIQSSAVGAYGPRGDEPIDESAEPGDDFLASVCRDWEASTESVEALGLRRAIIRSGVVLDDQGGALPLMLLPFKLFVGGPVGSGRQYFPWIHLQDEVDAIRFLIDRDELRGIFNLSAPGSVTNAAFGQAVGRAMHRPSFLPVPAFAMRLVLGELADMLLTGQRVLPKRLEEAGYRFTYPGIDEALAEIL